MAALSCVRCVDVVVFLLGHRRAGSHGTYILFSGGNPLHNATITGEIALSFS